MMAKIICMAGHQKFNIPTKGIKPWVRVCYYCPARKHCTLHLRHDRATVLKFYDMLRTTNMRTPVTKVIH